MWGPHCPMHRGVCRTCTLEPMAIKRCAEAPRHCWVCATGNLKFWKEAIWCPTCVRHHINHQVTAGHSLTLVPAAKLGFWQKFYKSTYCAKIHTEQQRWVAGPLNCEVREAMQCPTGALSH
jgi:hypothetical protein